MSRGTGPRSARLRAAATFAILWYTVISTRRDRRDTEARAERDRADAERRAVSDRADAERRLREERDLSERRIRREHDEAAEIRRRDRLRENAIGLIRRVSELQPRMAALTGLTLRERMGTSAFAAQRDYDAEQYNRESRALVESVRHGAWTEVALLGPGDAADRAAERYRALVRLADEAALTGSVTDRDIDTLLNYATWVRIILRMLLDEEAVPPIYGGSPEYPQLGLADQCRPGPLTRCRRDGMSRQPSTRRCAGRSVRESEARVNSRTRLSHSRRLQTTGRPRRRYDRPGNEARLGHRPGAIDRPGRSVGRTASDCTQVISASSPLQSRCLVSGR